MAGSKSAQKRGAAKVPAVTPMDRIRWSRDVSRLKAEGKTWPEVAAATGLSQAKCRRLHAQMRAAGDPDAPVDAWAWVHRHLDALVIVMEEASATYSAAPAGSSAAVGALKLWKQTSEDMLELAQRVGWTPRQLGALNAERAMQELFREFARIAEEHNASDELLRSLLDLAERRLSPGPPVVEGRATPI